jgi:hypothetical protein
MARPQKYKIADVISALRNSHGLKTGAAEILGCSFPTIDKYCNDSPEAQSVVDHWKKRRKDRAEYKLDEAIEGGEPWAVMFTLKNARDREYSERVEVGGQVVVEIQEPFNYDAAIAEVAHRPDEDSE